MKVERLRSRGEALCEELGRESYRTGAGLVAESHFADIFSRYPDLAGDEAQDAASGHPALLEWVVDNRIGRAVAELDDRLHAWESGAVVAAGGETIPYQRAAIEIANESRRERRLAIDAGRRAVLGTPTAIRRQRLSQERELLAALRLGDVVATRSKLSGMDLAALGDACGRFLDATADLYREALADALKGEPGIPPRDLDRSDAAYLFRGATFDDCFPGSALLPTAQRQVGEMGLDAGAGGRIRYDTEDRELKRARAFCAPVRIPDEVYLVIRPFGGQTDYRAFWHELGHAQHFANVGPSLPFEGRWLGDNSVTEGFAMLFEHLVLAPRWLARYTALGGERARAYARFQAFAHLAILRRYAAKLHYELELHRARDLEAGAAAYAPILTVATGFRYAPEDALLDLDDGFYAARYLRAWQLEALLAASLTERFDDDWFRNPRSGPALLDLFARGQRDDAAALAASVLGRALDFAPLVARTEAALA